MSEWVTTKLADIARIVTGGTPMADNLHHWGNEVDFITPSDQLAGIREAHPRRQLSGAGRDAFASRLVPARSTNLTCIGSTIGKVSMAMNPAVTNQQINSLLAIPGMSNPDFLYYLISGWSKGLAGFAAGSATPIVNKTDLGNFLFDVPPLTVQQAIAEVLGALDNKIAANTRLAAIADELAGVVYDAAVPTWARRPMSDVLSPVLGGTPSRANEDFWSPASDLWISARDVTSAPNRVLLDTVEKISRLATATTKAKPLPVGSVILTARGTVGAVARLARPAAFNQSCYGFAPSTVPAGVLFYSILRASEQARKIAHGSVFDTITKSTFDHLEMAWDSEAAPALNAQLTPLLHSIDGALEENRTLAATRDALLPKLMSGQLRVRDAEKIAERAGA